MINQSYQIIKIVWKDIPITIRHNANWSNAYFKINGYHLTHTEILQEDKLNLPITPTRYRSHFSDSRNLNQYKSITDFVTTWLDYDAKSKDWQAHIIDQQQLTLF